MPARFIGSDEWNPVFYITDRKTHRESSADVSDDLLSRYEANLKEFNGIQDELEMLLPDEATPQQ